MKDIFILGSFRYATCMVKDVFYKLITVDYCRSLHYFHIILYRFFKNISAFCFNVKLYFFYMFFFACTEIFTSFVFFRHSQHILKFETYLAFLSSKSNAHDFKLKQMEYLLLCNRYRKNESKGVSLMFSKGI